MCADFNERSFEFAFTAEFVRRSQPLLLTMPQIPSQREEKSLGYDVALVVMAGAAQRSIFLQHKVPTFAQTRWTNNTKVYDLYDGPYYRFYIDAKDGWNQHNRLRQRSSSDSTQQLTAYCSPAFHRVPDLEQRFFDLEVLGGTRWFPLTSMPDLSPADTDRHFISYNQAGTVANFHSDSKPFDSILTWDEVSHVRDSRPLSLDYFADLLAALREEARVVEPPQPVQLRMDDSDVNRLATIVEEIAGFLRRRAALLSHRNDARSIDGRAGQVVAPSSSWPLYGSR